MKVLINLDEVFLMLPSYQLLSLIVNAHSEQDEDSYLINNENSRGSLIGLGFNSSIWTLAGKREIPCARRRGKSMNRTIRYLT